MTPPLSLAALDAEGAIRAAAGAALGRGLVLAAGVALVLAVAMLAASALRRRDPGSAPATWRAALPHVVAGAAAVMVLGGLVAALAAGRNSAILEGTGALVATAGTARGAWALAAVALGGAVVALVLVARRRALPRVAWPAVLVTGIAVVAGMAMAPDLPRPDRQAQATIDLGDGVQGSVVLSPGAAGPNEVRVGLSGPPEGLEPVRAAARRAGASIELRELASGARGGPVVLALSDQGDLRGEGLVASAPGRWRVTLTLPDRADPVIADLTLQPNPGFRG